MAEPSDSETYIKCSKCRCKYFTDEAGIKTNLGFSRLNEQFKTCTKCRLKTKLKAVQRPFRTTKRHQSNPPKLFSETPETTSIFEKIPEPINIFGKITEPMSIFGKPPDHVSIFEKIPEPINIFGNPPDQSIKPSWNVFDKILEPFSDEEDTWGGKRN